MSDVSICCKKRNKFNERDTLKIFISYGDSLLLSGKSLHSFCGFFFFPVTDNCDARVLRATDVLKIQIYFPTGQISTIFAVAFGGIFLQKPKQSCD